MFMVISIIGQAGRKIIPYAALALLGVTLFVNSINGEFLWDDKSYIVDSPYIRDFKNISLIFQPWKFNQLPGGFVDTTRPLMFASLLLDYQLWGLDPKGYHITNITLHLISSFLVYSLSLTLSIKRSLSFVAALIFLAHPVHTEAVAGMTFREDLLVTSFFIASLIFFVRSVQYPERNLKTLYYLLSLAFYICAYLSKEMAVTLPLVVFIYFLSIHRGSPGYKKIFMSILPFVLVTIPYLVWISGTYGALTAPPSHGDGGIFYSIINIPLIVIYYIRVFFFPVNLSSDPGYVLKTSVMSGTVLLSYFIFTIFVVYLISGLRKKNASSFLLLFFFSTLLPVLQILPTFNLVAERFLYLPSVGLSIVFALTMEACIKNRKKFFLMTLIIFFFSLLTIERNFIWKDSLTLWTDAVKKNGESYFAHINIYNYHFEKRTYGKAEKGFLEIIGKWPDKPEAYNNLAIIYMDNHLYAEAEKILKRAISNKADTVETHMNLALTLNELRRYGEAIIEAKGALKSGPWLSGVERFLSEAYVALGKERLFVEDYASAMNAFDQAIAYGYPRPDMHVYLAQGYYGVGNYEKAIGEYKKVLSVNRNYGSAYFFIGQSLSKLGRDKEALGYYREFIGRWSSDGRYAGTARKMILELEGKL